MFLISWQTCNFYHLLKKKSNLNEEDVLVKHEELNLGWIDDSLDHGRLHLSELILILKTIGLSHKCVVKMSNICLGPVMISLDRTGTHPGNISLGESMRLLSGGLNRQGRLLLSVGIAVPWASGQQHLSMWRVWAATSCCCAVDCILPEPLSESSALPSSCCLCWVFFFTAKWKATSTGLFQKFFGKLKYILTALYWSSIILNTTI